MIGIFFMNHKDTKNTKKQLKKVGSGYLVRDARSLSLSKRARSRSLRQAQGTGNTVDLSLGINAQAQSSSTLKRTIAGFSLLLL